MKKIVIFLGHPAHFHLFKFVAQKLREKDFNVEFLVKRKDMLEDLVKAAGYDYTIVRKKERQSSSKMNIIWQTLKMDFEVSKYILKKRPDVLIGTYAPVFSGYLGVPIIIFNEDDAAAVPRFAKLGYPRASEILAPTFCDCGKWEHKAIKYRGYQKLAYLHPNEFTPDFEIAKCYLRNENRPYILMRFSKFNAHHDDNANGISNKLAHDIINKVKEKYDVYISSERPLDDSLEEYRISMNPLDIHHLMTFASLYVGDSQSMSVEAAMLGVPCIRFNSFVGKIKVGVIDELENKYHLLNSIHTGKPDMLLETISEMLNDESIKDKYSMARKSMLQEKIDVTAFITWFVENYPDSVKKIKEDPEIQNQFK